jgi:hypothetical protein
MAKKTSPAKWMFLLLAICVLLPVAFVLFLNLASKRHPKTDYLAEYNRISKPANFDPNDNAASYFDKAFEIMTEEPNDFASFRKLWPADMNDDQLQTTKQWVASNTQALDYLKQGISKKYYWKPLQAENNELMKADMNDLSKFRKATYLLCLDAKLMAYQGEAEPALQQLVDVYRIGTFLTGPRILVEQLVGMAISALSTQSAFQIIDRTKPSPVILEDFQRRITSLSSHQPFLVDLTAEKLMFYDVAQRRYYLGPGGMKFSDNPIYYLKSLWRMGPARSHLIAKETLKAQMLYDYLAALAPKNPWEIHSEGNDVSNTIEEMTKETLLLRVLAPAFDRVLNISYRNRVQTDALIATTAILRYKADKGSYPQDLQTLVTSGYLDRLPMDPFSSGPLSYKISGDSFILYSFAQDLDDDGGKHDSKWADEGDGDYVFWPVQKIETTDRTKKQN